MGLFGDDERVSSLEVEVEELKEQNEELIEFVYLLLGEVGLLREDSALADDVRKAIHKLRSPGFGMSA